MGKRKNISPGFPNYCAVESVNDKSIFFPFKQADIDGDGTLNYAEFVAVIIHIKKMTNDEHLRKAFSFFDQNNSGFIEYEELRDALNDEMDTCSDEVINAIMHDVDTDKVVRILLLEKWFL